MRVGKDVERDEVPYLFLSSTLPSGDFPGGPVIKNPPVNTRDTCLIPGLGTKIPRAMGQPSLLSATTEPMPWSLCFTTRETAAMRSLPTATREPGLPQLEKTCAHQ